MTRYRIRVGDLYVYGFRYFPSSVELPPEGTRLDEEGLPPQVVLAPSAVAVLGVATIPEMLCGKAASAARMEVPFVFTERGAAEYTAEPIGGVVEEIP